MRAMVQCARFVKCFGGIDPFAEDTVLTLLNAFFPTLPPIMEGAPDDARLSTQEMRFCARKEYEAIAGLDDTGMCMEAFGIPVVLFDRTERLLRVHLPPYGGHQLLSVLLDTIQVIRDVFGGVFARQLARLASA